MGRVPRAVVLVLVVIFGSAWAVRVDDDDVPNDSVPPDLEAIGMSFGREGRDRPSGRVWFLFSQDTACQTDVKLLAGDGAGVGPGQCQQLAEIDEQCGDFVNSNNDYCSCVLAGKKCMSRPSTQQTAIYKAKKAPPDLKAAAEQAVLAARAVDGSRKAEVQAAASAAEQAVMNAEGFQDSHKVVMAAVDAAKKWGGTPEQIAAEARNAARDLSKQSGSGEMYVSEVIADTIYVLKHEPRDETDRQVAKYLR